MKRCEDAAPLLGAFLDSALAGDDREWVEEHLRECAACRDRQAFIAAQAAALKERLEARGAQADFTGFADRVLARVLQDTELRGSEHLRVWGSEMWGAHRRAIVGAGGIFAAACLALAVVFTPPAAETIDEPLLADASIPQLEQVDFGSHDGAVTELRDRTPVIWLSEDRQ